MLHPGSSIIRLQCVQAEFALFILFFQSSFRSVITAISFNEVFGKQENKEIRSAELWGGNGVTIFYLFPCDF